jgi:hypothetical protein
VAGSSVHGSDISVAQDITCHCGSCSISHLGVLIAEDLLVSGSFSSGPVLALCVIGDAVLSGSQLSVAGVTKFSEYVSIGRNGLVGGHVIVGESGAIRGSVLLTGFIWAMHKHIGPYGNGRCSFCNRLSFR